MTSKVQVSKQNLIRLEHLKNKRMAVRFQGGREISGKLLSFDGGINLVFGDASEAQSECCLEKRDLGIVIVRGALVMSLFPEEGYQQIQNPFTGEEGQDQEQGNNNDSENKEVQVLGEQQ